MTDAAGHFGEMLDGLSCTAMIVEAPDKDRVYGTRPEDFESPDKEPLERLLGVWEGGFRVGLAERASTLVAGNVDLDQLSSMFRVDDGFQVHDGHPFEIDCPRSKGVVSLHSLGDCLVAWWARVQ